MDFPSWDWNSTQKFLLRCFYSGIKSFLWWTRNKEKKECNIFFQKNPTKNHFWNTCRRIRNRLTERRRTVSMWPEPESNTQVARVYGIWSQTHNIRTRVMSHLQESSVLWSFLSGVTNHWQRPGKNPFLCPSLFLFTVFHLNLNLHFPFYETNCDQYSGITLSLPKSLRKGLMEGSLL